MNVLRLLFDFRGRINRAKFWLASAIQLMFVIASEGLIGYYDFPALSAGGFLLLNIGQFVLFPLVLPLILLSAIGNRLELTYFRGYELARDVGIGTVNRIDVEFLVVNLACLLPLVVSLTAVGIKRLHDRDKSGWWLLPMYLVPVVFYVSPVMTMVAGWAVLIWPVVEFGFLRGTRGSNKYGPDPLASDG